MVQSSLFKKVTAFAKMDGGTPRVDRLLRLGLQKCVHLRCRGILWSWFTPAGIASSASALRIVLHAWNCLQMTD